MSGRAVGRDRTRRERRPSRLGQAFSEVLTENLAQALEGNRQAERILVGHKREMERLTREGVREKSDLNRDLTMTDKLLHSENEGLELLKKRKQRMEQEKQPTEIVEGQIVDTSRRILQYQEQQAKLKEKQYRVDEDLERERRTALENTQRQLKEANA
jgi:hypothetical protein